MKIKFGQRKTQVIAAVLVIFLGYLGWEIYRRGFAGKEGQATGQRGISVAVEIAPVEKGTVRDVGQFSGTLIPKSSFLVAPKISGRLKQLLIDIGDRVSRDQLVAVIEDEEYQQQLLQAEADLRVTRANLEEAESSLELANKDLERAKTLHQKGIQSDSQLDAAVSQHDAQEARRKVALAQLANREAALETARVRLSYSRIKASWEKGNEVRYVGERFVDEGAMLSPNTPIISIIELQPITAVIYVTDKAYFRLKTEQTASVTSSAFPGDPFSGRVARIAPLLKETTREARVEIEIQNPRGLLRPGLFINTQVEFGRREEATVVPVKALVNRDGRQGIFLADIENKKARFQPVTVGIVEGERAEVLEPRLLSGYVVTLGHHLLEDGTTIILPQTAPASPAAEAGTAQKPPQRVNNPPEVKR
ncbi:MAG TPA: efflux RND transporter periplasmic adaptor subunit [Candidatus Aminicenantes bacterium]|nr:efflux RND transporter periplasmic adaptor subunit [Candidatus Aminicenantes bacterium]